MNQSTFPNGGEAQQDAHPIHLTLKIFITLMLAILLFVSVASFAVPPEPSAPVPGTGFMYIGPNPAHAFDNPKAATISSRSDDLILSVATPSAECQANLDANFALLKKSATAILTPQDRSQMDDVRMQVVHFKDANQAGNTNYGSKVISLDVGLCEKPEINRQGVIAHELGHMVSLYRSKEAARIIADRRQYPNITFEQDETTMEAYANQYGAQIMRAASIDCGKWLAILDKECSDGSQYFCREAANWRGGLTY